MPLGSALPLVIGVPSVWNARLKIDRTFVRDITSDPDSASIARAITSMATSMELEVLAEGVETVGQLRLLRAQGCHEAQGYLLSRPIEADKLIDIIKNPKKYTLEFL